MGHVKGTKLFVKTKDEGVDTVFGYPGYGYRHFDELYKQDEIKVGSSHVSTSRL